MAFLIVGILASGQAFPTEAFVSFRAEWGLQTPAWDEKLALSSQDRAEELARAGVLSHEDSLGRGPGLQMTSQGMAPGVFGEVLGAGADFAKVWQAWLNSPSHRAILADPSWLSWGWGQAALGKTTVYVIRFRGR